MSDENWNADLWGTIYRAIKAGDLQEVIRQLESFPDAFEMIGPFGPWLHVAAKEGQVAIIKELLRRGADVQATGGLSENNALQEAVHKRHREAAEYLLDQGIAMELPGRPNNSPLFAAILNDDVQMLQLLIDRGINTEPENWDPIEVAKQESAVRCRALLEKVEAEKRAKAGAMHNPRAYSSRTESEQAAIDAGLKPYERFHQVTDLWSVTTGDARKAIVEAAKNYKGGDVSFRTHVANLFNDAKFLDKSDFGAYLYYHFGAPDADMVDAHGHHITYKKWIEGQADVVKEIHDTLMSVGINPIVGLENLIHAPNIEEQHSTEKLHEMADGLRTLKEAGGKYKDFVETLSRFGRQSREIGAQPPSMKTKAANQ